jgi:hypothetical protein
MQKKVARRCSKRITHQETLPFKNALKMVVMLALGHLKTHTYTPAPAKQERPDKCIGQKQPKYLAADVRTVEGLLSQKASRQMLQASSQASCTPPSTKAAAEDSLLSIVAFSSISAARYQTGSSSSRSAPVYPHLSAISYSQRQAKRASTGNNACHSIKILPLHATNLARNGKPAPQN